MVLRSAILVSLLTVACGALGAASIASAAPKLSYAAAWRTCKAELDRERVPGPMVSNDRYIRGGACMARYGYRF